MFEERASQISSLIEAARQDPRSLDELLDLFRNYLVVLARSKTYRGMQAKIDCSDIVQETLVKAHQRFEQFRGGSEAELAAWLRQTLSRSLVDALRRFRGQGRDMRRERSLEGLVEASSQAFQNFLNANVASPSQSAQRRELAVVLSDALESLEPDLRDVIICKNIKEMSWDQTAEEMGRSISAVRILWTKALKQLRPLIESKI